MISLTGIAVSKLKEMSESDGIGHLTIRVGVKGAGCSGFMTDMFFDDQIKDTDVVFNFDDVKIIVDEVSFQYLDGTVIDYIEGLMSSGFKFNMPNIQGTCGCGKSWY
jgi:iron-sulfur cluster insertion protein